MRRINYLPGRSQGSIEAISCPPEGFVVPMTAAITPAERVLAECATKRQLAAVKSVHGQEGEALIELVRAADSAAFASKFGPHDENAGLMIRGIAPALAPFLKKLRGRPGPVPWWPTTPGLSAWADQLLIDCGLLTWLRRLAAAERYGLSKTHFRGSGKLVITVDDDRAEASGRRSEAWLRRTGQRFAAGTDTNATLIDPDEAARRLDRYVQPQYGWFLRYDSDAELEDFYYDQAEIWSWGIAEGEALPDAAIVAGRRFEEWREVNIMACSRAVQHIACATRLQHHHPELDLRNLLTLYCRKDDMMNFWHQYGESDEGVLRIIDYLTLGARTVTGFEEHYETPIPYYIEFGPDFLLVPMFGALLNADRKSTRLNSSHNQRSRMPSSA